MLSRVGIDDVQVGVPGLPTFGDPAVAEARSVSALCAGVRVWSLYIPNGRAVGDPHYDYKLQWLAAVRDYGATELAADPQAQIAFCGDFNIAPTDDDIWSVEYYRNSTHVTPPERQAFTDLVDAGFTDVVRPHTPGPGRLHLLGLHPARLSRSGAGCGSTSRWPVPRWPARVTGARIDREERKGKLPSDHAPVIVETGGLTWFNDIW